VRSATRTSEIAKAVALQATRLVHTSNLYHHEPGGELARQLTARSGMHGVFFCKLRH